MSKPVSRVVLENATLIAMSGQLLYTINFPFFAQLHRKVLEARGCPRCKQNSILNPDLEKTKQAILALDSRRVRMLKTFLGVDEIVVVPQKGGRQKR